MNSYEKQYQLNTEKSNKVRYIAQIILRKYLEDKNNVKGIRVVVGTPEQDKNENIDLVAHFEDGRADEGFAYRKYPIGKFKDGECVWPYGNDYPLNLINHRGGNEDDKDKEPYERAMNCKCELWKIINRFGRLAIIIRCDEDDNPVLYQIYDQRNMQEYLRDGAENINNREKTREDNNGAGLFHIIKMQDIEKYIYDKYYTKHYSNAHWGITAPEPLCEELIKEFIATGNGIAAFENYIKELADKELKEKPIVLLDEKIDEETLSEYNGLINTMDELGII